jgi:hypothetical protein
MLLAVWPAWGAELELRYGAIERVIADQLFSQDGRLYVRGNKTTRCSSPIWNLRMWALPAGVCGFRRASAGAPRST